MEEFDSSFGGFTQKQNSLKIEFIKLRKISKKYLKINKYYVEKIKLLREPFEWMESTTVNYQTPSRSSNNFNSRTGVVNQGESFESKINIEESIEVIQPKGFLGSATKVRGGEITLSLLFEEYSNNLSQKLGISSTPWFKLMQMLETIYLVITLL